MIEGAPQSKRKGAGSTASQSGGGAGSERALPQCPPHPLQVFVVELSRKPLFPGIYTPVLVLKNERLIKEVMEAKKHGWV